MAVLSPALIDARRLVTPREHQGLLIEPAPASIRAGLSAPRPGAETAASLLGEPLATWRRSLQERLGLAPPVITTGHQCEFYHAGVFAKGAALDILAQLSGGSGLFLAVDSDLPKGGEIVVPQVTSGGVRRISVEVPGCDLGLAVEHQARLPHAQWVEFFARVASFVDDYAASVLRTYADAWLASEGELDFAAALARADAAVARALALTRTRILRVSELCATPEFRAFVAHLVLHAAAFAEHYNAAQCRYRRRRRIRNRSRPVPQLVVHGARVELPFWLTRGAGRLRMSVQTRAGRCEIYAGDVLVVQMRAADLARPSTHDRPWALEAAGWRIRPRALTLSSFARLLLCDLFIHGIGGAKYDEMTGDFAPEFFGTELAPLCCVSATLHLPLPLHGVTPDEIRAAQRASRDVRFNPQRYLKTLPAEQFRQRVELIRQAEHLRRAEPADREARQAVFRAIRQENARLLRQDPWRPGELEERAKELEQRRREDEAALDREYFYALHPRRSLELLVERIHAAFGAGR